MVTSYEPQGAVGSRNGGDKQVKERVLVHDVVEDHSGSEYSKKSRSSDKVSCPKCKGQHRLPDCEAFRALNVKQRWEFVKIEGGDVDPQRQNENKRISESAVLFHSRPATKTLFRYIPVTIFGKARKVHTYALIEIGAECTLIEIGELELDGPSKQLCLKWTGDVTQIEHNSKSVYLSVSATGKEEQRDASITRKLDEAMKSYFSIESIGVSIANKPLRSKEDERSLQIVEKTTKYLSSEKRWERGLLWKFDSVELPDSYNMAIKRLNCLEAKMVKDPQLSSFMVNTMKSYSEKGCIRKLSEVTNPNKNKTRLVWDAADKVHGVSLNDVLLKGPVLLASVIGVVMRFRERRIAVTGDIREIFLQVKVRQEDLAV
ncbi:PREDICTED: uncharacterized protein LOC108360623 [Rhagoletis zephyria]|uniref:uncharacterized protein LOC108360623 n=1 Tax=Rhagoletis zephyria TaxID=28612 RepID=UPI00081125EA|nr:PREDICTED: uncharacterized protein LOC108360623 [Rhagoletis zephyria]